jgi:hypothetical protein
VGQNSAYKIVDGKDALSEIQTANRTANNKQPKLEPIEEEMIAKPESATASSSSTTTTTATRGTTRPATKSELQTRGAAASQQSKNNNLAKQILGGVGGALVVKFDLISKETMDENLYTIDFTMSVKKQAVTTVLKRQVIKCDMCTYMAVLDSDTIDTANHLHVIKNHVINKHLTTVEADDDSSEQVDDDDPDNDTG